MITILKKLYSDFWVPIFGRILSVFIQFLEGKPPKNPPTFDIDKKNTKSNN